MSQLAKFVNKDYRQISLAQKSLLAVGSGLLSIFDPSRDDMISTFGETTALWTLNNLKRKMLADPEGSLILEEKPIVNSKIIDLNKLAQLPSNTFGRAYVEMLRNEHITPDSRKPVYFVQDAELAYIMRRYRETHDFVHCILGMPTNMLGEVSVKWFEAVQLGLPMCWLAGYFGSLRLGPKHTQYYLNDYLPWTIQTALNSNLLLNVYFEKYFEEPLDDMRARLNIQQPPNRILKSKPKIDSSAP